MDEFDAELEQRLQRLESPDGGGMVQPDLPWVDVAAAVVGLATVSTLLFWWAHL